MKGDIQDYEVPVEGFSPKAKAPRYVGLVCGYIVCVALTVL